MNEEKKRKQKRYREKNRERIRQYARKWYWEHRDRSREWSKRKFEKNPQRHRALIRKNYLDRTYGPGGAEYYERQLAKQKGRCAICGKPAGRGQFGRLHQDHNTACCPYDFTPEGKRKMLRSCGKCRRGLLCNNCNSALVGVEDPKWRRKASAYLRRWGSAGIAATLEKQQLNLF